MSIRLPYEDVVGLTTGAATSPLLEHVDAARRAYCNLYVNHPTWTFVKDNITLPVVKRTLDNFCGDIGSPPVPDPPPFTGGQCVDAPYNIRVTAEITASGGARVPIVNNLTVTGGISNVFIRRGQGAGQNDEWVVIYRVGSSAGTVTEVFNQSSQASNAVFLEVLVARQDGLPDDCGDPPSETYPPESPPDSGDVTQTVNVTNNNGDSIDYNTVVNFDVDGTVIFPPTIEVEGLEITIDVGGVSIDNSKGRRSGGGGGAIEPLAEETEEIETMEEERLVAITVTAVGDTDDPFPSTSGRGTSPDVFYVGWVQFEIETFSLPRQFIHFEKSRFEAPEGATDYTVRFNPSWTGTVEEIIETVEVPVVPEEEGGGSIEIEPL